MKNVNKLLKEINTESLIRFCWRLETEMKANKEYLKQIRQEIKKREKI